MQPLTHEFVNNCREEHGFKLRGENMTRMEVFVDASFAFAVTMLIISIDQIPRNIPELIAVTKDIPAFAVSVFQLMWIWHTHSVWSKRFGLEGAWSVFLSVILIILVLVYIYPLKIMFSGFFAWVTAGYLPSAFDINSIDDLRIMFLYFAIGFMMIFTIYYLMYWHAMRLAEPLRLKRYEVHATMTQIKIYRLLIGVGGIAAIAAIFMPSHLVQLSGFVYSLIGVVYFLVERSQSNAWQQEENSNRQKA